MQETIEVSIEAVIPIETLRDAIPLSFRRPDLELVEVHLPHAWESSRSNIICDVLPHDAGWRTIVTLNVPLALTNEALAAFGSELAERVRSRVAIGAEVPEFGPGFVIFNPGGRVDWGSGSGEHDLHVDIIRAGAEPVGIG